MSWLSRRRFLEQSMFTTAAAMALHAQRTGANEPQPQPPSIGPNDTIQVAVIGAGGRGQSHIDGFAGKPGSVVTHICDCDEKAGQRSCEKAAEKQGGKKPVWVKDVRKLLEDKSINAVSIATPNHWHSLGAIWAIQAGKDVYVEKPV
ncbi:MAG: Gfo/Idh/MocA family protein, partial [Planctomycetota bacterium]